MNNYVKRFIPKIVSENDTMKNLYEVENDEISNLTSELHKVIDNNYIVRSDINGIKDWEKLLGITPNANFSFEERKQICLNKRLYKPPFTRHRLMEILKGIWGEGNYIFSIYPDRFQVVIDINTTNPIIYLQFSNNVRHAIPANMELIFSIQYTYLYLNRNFNYNKLETLTYGELSQYLQI